MGRQENYFSYFKFVPPFRITPRPRFVVKNSSSKILIIIFIIKGKIIIGSLIKSLNEVNEVDKNLQVR